MQRHVIQKRRPLVKRHVQAVVQIVIKIGAGGNDPIHEPRAHERNQARFAQAGRRQRAGQAHADQAVARQHFFRQQLGRLAQAPAVVGQKRLIDQIGGGNIFADAQRIEARISGKFGRLCSWAESLRNGRERQMEKPAVEDFGAMNGESAGLYTENENRYSMRTMNTVTSLKIVKRKVASAGRSRPGRERRIAAAGALLGAALLSPARQTPQTPSRRSLRLRPEPRRHRRALVRLHHARRQRKPHAGRRA